ncbi:MAG: hypothetical protein H7329_14290 [Opitutaceae bacterium]|nr:hypothetical protein [Cytophagales bacterium]
MKTSPKQSKKELAAIEEAAVLAKQKEDKRRLKSYAPDTWKKIESWGRESGNLSQHLQGYCFTISGRIRKNIEFEGFELANGVKVLDIVAEHAPELLVLVEKQPKIVKLEVTIDVIAQVVLWDRKNKILKPISYTFMAELATGKKPLSEQNKKIAGWNLEIVQKCGFLYKPSPNVDIINNPVKKITPVGIPQLA